MVLMLHEEAVEGEEPVAFSLQAEVVDGDSEFQLAFGALENNH